MRITYQCDICLWQYKNVKSALDCENGHSNLEFLFDCYNRYHASDKALSFEEFSTATLRAHLENVKPVTFLEQIKSICKNADDWRNNGDNEIVNDLYVQLSEAIAQMEGE